MCGWVQSIRAYVDTKTWQERSRAESAGRKAELVGGSASYLQVALLLDLNEIKELVDAEHDPVGLVVFGELIDVDLNLLFLFDEGGELYFQQLLQFFDFSFQLRLLSLHQQLTLFVLHAFPLEGVCLRLVRLQNFFIARYFFFEHLNLSARCDNFFVDPAVLLLHGFSFGFHFVEPRDGLLQNIVLLKQLILQLNIVVVLLLQIIGQYAVSFVLGQLQLFQLASQNLDVAGLRAVPLHQLLVLLGQDFHLLADARQPGVRKSSRMLRGG